MTILRALTADCTFPWTMISPYRKPSGRQAQSTLYSETPTPAGGSDPGDFDYAHNVWKTMVVSSTFGNLTLDKRWAAAQLMIAPKLAAADESALFPEAKGGIWARNYGERVPLQGGRWTAGAGAGLAALALSERRPLVFGYGGCRPAFILKP
jgi:hypothetical protein